MPKLWSPLPQDLKWKTDKIHLRSDFVKQKNNKPITLVAYDTYILMYKVFYSIHVRKQINNLKNT